MSFAATAGPAAAPPAAAGSTPFTLETLIGLVRHANALLHRGDTLGTPLPDETRAIIQAAVSGWCRRIFTHHLGPAEGAVNLGTLTALAKAADRYVASGDNIPAALEPPDVSLTYAFRQEVVTRLAAHPGGETTAELLNERADARAAWERARQVPRPVLTPRREIPAPPAAEAPKAAAPAAEAAPARPVAVASDAPAAMLPDSFTYGADKAPPGPPKPAPGTTPAGTGERRAETAPSLAAE